MKTRLFQTLFVILLLALLATSATAEVPVEPVVPDAETLALPLDQESALAPPVVWGGVTRDLWGGRSGYLHPFVSIGERYTDNLFRTDTDRQSEWTTLITPGIWLVVPESRQQLPRVNTMIAVPGGTTVGRYRSDNERRLQGYALYQADIEKHARFHEEDRVNHRGEGLFRYTSPRGFSLELLDVYEQEQDPFTTGGTRRELETVAANLLQGRASAPLGTRLRLDLGYANYRVEFDDSRNAFRDREDNAVSTALACRVSPKTDLLLLYEHIDIDYQRSLLPESVEQHVYIGSEWKLTGKSQGRILLGYGQKDFRPAGNETRHDLIGEARLEHRFTPKTSVYLQANRKTNEPDSAVGGGTLAHQLQLGGRQRLTGKITAALDVSYLREAYRQTMTIDDQTKKRLDDYTSAGLGLEYTLWTGVRLDFGYRHLVRDSNFETLRYRSNTVFLRLSAAF